MPPPEQQLGAILRGLRDQGYVRVAGLDLAQYRALAEGLGEIVGDERIALRPGAHAYVAKPGPVPLHTDQPEVETIGWFCARQDDQDGASLLLDTRPVVGGLSEDLRRRLLDVHLVTPPLAGGPPTMTWPVLRETPEGAAVFCSPWLRSASPNPDHTEVLEIFRHQLSDAIGRERISIRLEPGDALFVNNRRVLHGRGAIDPASRRCLRRLWVQRTPSETFAGMHSSIATSPSL